MKKIFTLLLAMGSLSAVFAQSGRDYKDGYPNQDKKMQPSRDYDRNSENNAYAYNDRRNNNYAYSRERAFQLEKINREYDYRVNSVVCNRRLRPFEKNRILHDLDVERAYRIREVNARFDQRRFDDSQYDRGNNYHH